MLDPDREHAHPCTEVSIRVLYGNGFGDGNAMFSFRVFLVVAVLDLATATLTLMRGWNYSSDGRDASRTFGSLQEDAFKSHSHTYSVVAANRSAHAFRDTQSMYGNGSTDTGSTGDIETRPVNLPFLACIKW